MILNEYDLKIITIRGEFASVKDFGGHVFSQAILRFIFIFCKRKYSKVKLHISFTLNKGKTHLEKSKVHKKEDKKTRKKKWFLRPDHLI